MGVKLLESYMLGDMKALYFLDDEKRLAELMLLPAEMEPLTWTEKHQEIDALIQLKTGTFRKEIPCRCRAERQRWEVACRPFGLILCGPPQAPVSPSPQFTL